jgi:hypothetical protein
VAASPTAPASLELDTQTLNRRDTGMGTRMISDRAFFQLLGCRTIRALDITDYEGAEVIHDLAKPLPPDLHGIADFVVDGSTLDNTFDPARTLRNCAALLRAGGRLLTINAFSCWDTPYVIMPPMWFLDYFVTNRFVDCKAYVLIFDHDHARAAVYWLDVAFLQLRRREMGRFIAFDAEGRALNPPYHMLTVVFAEKGPDSVDDLSPVQQDYRSDADWEVYLRNLEPIVASPRAHLIRSTGEPFFGHVPGGHRLIGDDYQAMA